YLIVSSKDLSETVSGLAKSSLTPELHKLIAVVEADPLLEAQVAKSDTLVSELSA
ncbi:hypothetical protein GGI03_004717, partial [Coemansia sp. RSA 2337]